MMTHTNARTLSAISLSDLNTTINHEPRVRDLDLAERLGFTDPHKVRTLIERNRAELETHGVVSATVAETSAKGGRPGKEYYLNEGQALVICALSRTPSAAVVRHDLITVYMEYRRGLSGNPAIAHQPAPALPPPAEPPFCTGCAARGQWNLKGADRHFHPLATGPLTLAELRAAGNLREAIKEAAADVAADNTRLRREAGQFAAIKAILMGETK